MRLRRRIREDEPLDLGAIEPAGEPVSVQAPERV
jgi:hypothetical protein